MWQDRIQTSSSNPPIRSGNGDLLCSLSLLSCETSPHLQQICTFSSGSGVLGGWPTLQRWITLPGSPPDISEGSHWQSGVPAPPHFAVWWLAAGISSVGGGFSQGQPVLEDFGRPWFMYREIHPQSCSCRAGIWQFSICQCPGRFFQNRLVTVGELDVLVVLGDTG